MSISSRRPSVAVVGGANVDVVVRVGVLPAPGETVLGGDLTRLAGGKGANQAAAAAALGARVAMIGAVGTDADGEWLVKNLRDHGVDVSRVARVDAPTGTAFITVDAAGENHIVVSPGANTRVSLEHYDDDVDVTLTQLEIPLSIIEELVSHRAPVVVNAAPASRRSSAALRACAVVIANEGEATHLDLTDLEHCVVTLGARGAVHLRYGVVICSAQPPPVDVIDAVGAGDVFCAAYTTQWASGSDPAVALKFAVTAGALATRENGAQGCLPTDEEVGQWLDRAS